MSPIHAKGQLILKAIYGLLTSPKKRTDEFDLFALKSKKANKTNSSVCFLGESMARQSAFEINLPLKEAKFQNISFIQGMFGTPRSKTFQLKIITVGSCFFAYNLDWNKLPFRFIMWPEFWSQSWRIRWSSVFVSKIRL